MGFKQVKFFFITHTKPLSKVSERRTGCVAYSDYLKPLVGLGGDRRHGWVTEGAGIPVRMTSGHILPTLARVVLLP